MTDRPDDLVAEARAYAEAARNTQPPSRPEYIDRLADALEAAQKERDGARAFAQRSIREHNKVLRELARVEEECDVLEARVRQLEEALTRLVDEIELRAFDYGTEQMSGGAALAAIVTEKNLAREVLAANRTTRVWNAKEWRRP